MSAVPLVTPLAHAGPGASWQALVTTVCAGVAVVFVLAVAGRIRLDDVDDLVLPLAVVAILSAAAPAASATLSDLIGVAAPAGVMLLGGLVAATLSPLQLGPRSRLTWAVVVLAVGAALVLQAPLTAAWHPPTDTPAAAVLPAPPAA